MPATPTVLGDSGPVRTRPVFQCDSPGRHDDGQAQGPVAGTNSGDQVVMSTTVHPIECLKRRGTSCRIHPVYGQGRHGESVPTPSRPKRPQRQRQHRGESMAAHAPRRPVSRESALPDPLLPAPNQGRADTPPPPGQTFCGQRQDRPGAHEWWSCPAPAGPPG